MESFLRHCEYCGGSIHNSDLHCSGCGAPIVTSGAPLPDFRICPFCKRKLLALGSPACNYCGRRLPDDYLKAREADLRRVNEITEAGEDKRVSAKLDELIRQSARRDSQDSGDGSDVASLLDLLS